MPKNLSIQFRTAIIASVLLLLTAPLIGCASTKATPPKLTMTSQMFECRAKPDVPSGDFSDATLATYMVRLVLAHEDCRAQLSTVRNHLEINDIQVMQDPDPKEPVAAPKKILGLF